MNHQILIVDDMEENLYALEHMLTNDKYLFIKAASGNEALKIAYKQESISLIMLDVQMPGMDGFEVADLLKSNQKTAGVPIIFVTAISKDSKYVLKGLEGGAIDYLFKPLDPIITRAKVATILKMVEQQNEIIRQNRELAALNKEKNNLLGMAAHDLRSPLASMLMFSEFMEEGGPGDEEQVKMLIDIVKSSSRQMLNLIDELLDISKIEAGHLVLQLRETDLDALIVRIVERNQMIAGKKDIRLVYHAGLPGFTISIDPNRMEQVLDNLISNAIKYSGSGTTTITLTEKDDSVWISVRDQGQGIPKTEINKLFKPFQTAKSVSSTGGEKSTGLGLAIVKRIVEAHKGEIKVSSKQGKGSDFYFSLPLPKAANKTQQGPQ